MRDYCTFSPDKLFGIQFGTPCCKKHDENYSLGGISTSRKGSDLLLRMCIRRQLINGGKSIFISNIISKIYYFAVRTVGWWFWKTWAYHGIQPKGKQLWIQRWKNLTN